MWRADKRHGVGTCYNTNGDIFVGTFVDGKRHGLGTTYMPSRGAQWGRVLTGGRLQVAAASATVAVVAVAVVAGGWTGVALMLPAQRYRLKDAHDSGSLCKVQSVSVL
jgi:hypothetical protein